MSIDAALTSALSGLKANQEMFGVLSNNIANVNNPHYARRVVNLESVVTGGVGQGVHIASITRAVDSYLVDSIRQQTSKVGYANETSEYYDQIQQLFGKPGEKGNLAEVYNEFFSALTALATSPDILALKQNVINNGQVLANKFVEIATNLQELRYNADQRINDAINNLNQDLSKLREINAVIFLSKNQDGAQANLLEQRDNILADMSKYMDISIYYKSDGTVNLNTADGLSLLDDTAYLIQYTPIPNVETLIENSEINPVLITAYDPDTRAFGASTTLITGGQSNAISSNLNSGSILALQNMRDGVLPDILSQLDNLAAKFRDNFNTFHNNGAGFPPATTLNGTRPVTSNEQHNWIGSVMIGLVDVNGNPLTQQDGQSLMPLNLKLDQLDSGYGAGQLTIQTIIDEFNEYYYYSPTETKVALGNLNNIKLVATSNLSTEPNGQVTLDFDVENNSQDDSQFQIVGISITDTSAAGLVSPLPGIANILAGTRGKAGCPVNISFAGGSGGPYKIQAQIKVVDSNGAVSFSTIEYVVNDNPGTLEVVNNRYNVETIISGDAQLVAPNNTQYYAQAVLVDSNGNPVSSGTPGYLQINTNNDQYYLAINEMTSQERGLSQQTLPVFIPAQIPTYFGFSHFFGLNDFFVNENPNETLDLGSSLNMAVRSDILADPTLISLGQLTQSTSYYQTEIIGSSAASANLVFQANPSLGDTINFNGTSFTFVASATLPSQITIGASLSETLTNIVSTLNAVNSYTAGTTNKATFSTDGVVALDVVYNALGVIGNGVGFGANLSTPASMNAQSPSLNPFTGLQGGAQGPQEILVQPNTYSLSSGNDVAIASMAALAQKTSIFSPAGSMPVSSLSYVNYAASIISKAVTDGIYAANKTENENLINEGLMTRYEADSGVNLDEELANTIIYQNAYSANARVIKVTKDLFDILMQAF